MEGLVCKQLVDLEVGHPASVVLPSPGAPRFRSPPMAAAQTLPCASLGLPLHAACSRPWLPSLLFHISSSLNYIYCSKLFIAC